MGGVCGVFEVALPIVVSTSSAGTQLTQNYVCHTYKLGNKAFTTAGELDQAWQAGKRRPLLGQSQKLNNISALAMIIFSQHLYLFPST